MLRTTPARGIGGDRRRVPVLGKTGLGEAGPDKSGIRPSPDDEPGNRMVAWLSAMSGIKSPGEIAPRCIAGQPFIDMVTTIAPLGTESSRWMLFQIAPPVPRRLRATASRSS